MAQRYSTRPSELVGKSLRPGVALYLDMAAAGAGSEEDAQDRRRAESDARRHALMRGGR